MWIPFLTLSLYLHESVAWDTSFQEVVIAASIVGANDRENHANRAPLLLFRVKSCDSTTSVSVGKGSQDYNSSKGKKTGTLLLGTMYMGTRCTSLEKFIFNPLVIATCVYK